MSENVQVRQIPKKTFIWFGVMVVLAIGVYLLTENTRVNKANFILENKGYTNISNLKVYSKQKFEDPKTMIQGYQYFVKFTNNDTNQNCKGFVVRNFKNIMDSDITCSKGK
jgi:hypothetical protein